MNLELTEKRALVCGSSQGIGRAIAIEMASLGANVLLVARNREALEKVRLELDDSQRQKHNILIADFEQPEALGDKVELHLAEHGPVHILVNNTGGPPAGLASEAKVEEFVQGFSNHLVCNQLLMQAVLPGMKEAGYGRIINVISTSVKQPLPGLGVSNTIRGAVASWAKTLATELGPLGITVNNVLPGATKTARLDALISGKAKKMNTTEERIVEQMKTAIPARRFGEAEELAFAAAFLASPSASYINGINLPVDGGRTASL